ncbi:7 transmembrane receptor (rhodopsin family) [Popillia japonica]|uniref:7 transmembrane receptor (Rhodopsin family) n=1 Tax=Popillia japonica TaxID=7064 RepID=A0AAW1IAF4_POPJA
MIILLNYTNSSQSFSKKNTWMRSLQTKLNLQTQDPVTEETVSVTVSVLTLTFISIDRWYAICYPLKFKSTTGRAKTAIFIIWLLALLFDIPELIVYRTKKMDLQVDTIYFTQCSTSWSRRADTSWTLLKMVLLYGIPLIFMSATYCQIVRVLWKSGCGAHQPVGTSVGSGRSVSTFPNTNVNLEGQLRSRKKAAKMLVAVVVMFMFAFCYFPVHLLSALRIMVNLTNSDMNRALSLISHWLCYANSAVNPIIYNFMSGKFRKEFRRAFDCCTSSEDHHGYEMNSMCCKNATRDTGLGSHYSRSFRRTNTCRRTWVQGKSIDEARSTRTSETWNENCNPTVGELLLSGSE